MTTLAQSLADLQIAELARLESEFVRRAQGFKPWTIAEFLDKVAAVHARYARFTQFQQKQVA
ncbi:hypothetical protein ACFV0B_11165 [Streptomyces xanthophaeus]|uniref:hypothetical protein n=1 Tax=Streptomyces xanthophaeus TaxID=67385 RepID=UPI0036A84D75